MFVEQLRIGNMDNFGYLVADEDARIAAVIDPSFDARPMQASAARKRLQITLILNTHGHYDHVFDNDRLAKDTAAKVAAHRLARVRKDISLEGGEVLNIGSIDLKVLHTPGHSPDACCFIAGDALFTGDTLFVGECGRTDLPGSDVEAMHDSLLNKLRGLDDDLTVYPGHDYGDRPFSKLGYEKKNNYTLKPRNLQEFIRFMREP